MSDCVYMAILIILFLLVLLCIMYLYVRYQIDKTKSDIVEGINNIILNVFRREAKETK